MFIAGNFRTLIATVADKNLKSFRSGVHDLGQKFRFFAGCTSEKIAKDRGLHFPGILVDTLVSDLLVDGLVVVDPKVVTEFNDSHVAQMMGSLAITGFRLAIQLNFKYPDLRQRRVVR